MVSTRRSSAAAANGNASPKHGQQQLDGYVETGRKRKATQLDEPAETDRRRDSDEQGAKQPRVGSPRGGEAEGGSVEGKSSGKAGNEEDGHDASTGGAGGEAEPSKGKSSGKDGRNASTGGAGGEAEVAVDLHELDERQKQDDNKLQGDDTEVHREGSEKSEVQWHVKETGLIYFFYRPKVQAEAEATKGAVHSLDGVQNSFMLLVPRRSESDTAPAPAGAERDDDADRDKRRLPNPTGYRYIALGRKRLPDVELALAHGEEPRGIGGRDSEATWATVSSVGADLTTLVDGMKESRYSTKTRGERVQPAARPAGRGHYVLSSRETEPQSQREVRLTYHLSHPSSQDFGDVQNEIGIHPSSSVLLQMRNPTMPPTGPEAPTAGLPEERRAKLTDDEMQQTFGGDLDSGGNRYARPEDPALLDREGVELLIIKRRGQEEHGLQGAGDEQAQALRDIAERDAEQVSDEKVLEELKLSTKDTEVEALSGDWI